MGLRHCHETLQELDRRGVVDISRIAVGGHSYGAFMAANLLAHAPELFACGIARSGAYNRYSLTLGCVLLVQSMSGCLAACRSGVCMLCVTAAVCD